MATQPQSSDLERELAELLEIERFEPPAEFREQTLWSDSSVYEEAAADPEAWWLRQASELLDWVREPSQGLDESKPPFYKWFSDGTLNASAKDRKSTRLNSSHSSISYAVFCLKKKKKEYSSHT